MFKPQVKGTGGKDTTPKSKPGAKIEMKDLGVPTNVTLTKKAFNLNQGCKRK